jgi:hypothetical protein
MDEPEDPFDFEHYQPRASVTIPTSRRGLLAGLFTELKAFNEKVEGKPTLKISDLGLLPEEEFAQLKPVLVKGCKIKLQKNQVWATPPAALEPVLLFPVDAPALDAFNLFNGKNTIEQIVCALIEKTGWADEKAQVYTRGLFLKLVTLRVCEPG